MNSALNSNASYVIGIDVGGTSTKFGIVRSDGQILGQSSIPTCETADPSDFIKRLKAALEKLIEQSGVIGKVTAIGVGAPNGNHYSGHVEYAPNLKWNGIVPLASMIESALGLKTTITNDANAAALGELKFGAAKGLENFIIITLGTGLGGGVVVDGKLVYGHTGFAGELGHMIVEKGGRECGCGRKGCLETYASATGVVRTAQEKLSNFDEPSVLRTSTEPLTALAVAQAAERGDTLAKAVLRETGIVLGEALADMAAVTSPEAFFIFGGLTKAGSLLMEPVQDSFEASILNVLKGKTRIEVSGLPESDAAILGAAAVAE